MKLVGIEEVDLTKAKKVLEMLYKLSRISDEFGNGIKVYNTVGEPVNDCRYNQGWGDGWLECVYFVYSYRADKALEDLIKCMNADINRLDAEVKRLDSVVEALTDLECPEFRGDRG